jgi:hypothetical protein
VIIINPESVKNNLDAVLKEAEDVFKGSNTLFIIDDCANLQDAKKGFRIVSFSIFRGHYSLAIWILNQKYNFIVNTLGAGRFFTLLVTSAKVTPLFCDFQL